MNRAISKFVDNLLEHEETSADETITAAAPAAEFTGQRIAPAQPGSPGSPDYSPDVEDVRALNWEALQHRNSASIVQLVYASFPTNTKFIRVHESPDLAYAPDYYEAWGFIARDNLDVVVSVYTHRTKDWHSHLVSLPQNLLLVDLEETDAQPAAAAPEVEAGVHESALDPEETLAVYADEDDVNTFDLFI